MVAKLSWLCLLITVGFSARYASASTFGLTFDDQGSCTGCAARTEVELLNAQLLSYSDSFSLTGTAGALSAFSGSIANGALHGYSQINTGTLFNSHSSATLDAYFYDTFHILGPIGQSGQFNITLNFDGSAPATGVAALGTYVNTYNLLENGTVIPGQQYSGIISTLAIPFGSSNTQLTRTVSLTFAAGSSVTLGQLLQLRSFMLDDGSSGSLTIDDSNTGYFTVTPVTAGFSFSTDSGLAYNGLTAAPEPSYLGLTAFMLLAVALKLRLGTRHLRKG